MSKTVCHQLFERLRDEYHVPITSYALSRNVQCYAWRMTCDNVTIYSAWSVIDCLSAVELSVNEINGDWVVSPK